MRPRPQRYALLYQRRTLRLAHASDGDDSMFSVGQMVWHRDGQRSGTVVECEGSRVYITQENGAEVDFPADALTATPPAGVKVSAPKLRSTREPVKPQAPAAPPRALTSDDITPDHVRVLRIVPVRTLQAIASLYERRAGAGKFSALDTARKLNVITEITAIPYRVMREYSDRPGELGLLMGKGLADSQRGF